MPKKASKAIAKGIQDVAWGGSGATSTMTVEGLKAIVSNLSPAEAYQLSIDVKTAVSAIAQNICKAQLRLFDRRSGEEITGGDLFDLLKRPAPYWSTCSFIQELVSHYLLAGEMAASVLLGGSGRVSGIIPLNPLRLDIQDLPQAAQRSEIRSWRYFWPNGVQVIVPNEQLLFEKNFNPLSQVRGLPPILGGIQEASAAYQAFRYNSQFFANNALPNHILILPPGISPKDKQAFKDQYIGMHSAYGGQAHKVMVVEGGEGLDIKPLEQPFKEMQFEGLIRLSTERIMRLYRVPPVIGGVWDSTKFDSVDVQRETFTEEVLLPIMGLTNGMLQSQLVDHYFRGTSISRSAAKMGGELSKAFDRARAERTESDILVLLDPDTLPIMGKLKKGRVEYAQKLQATFKITPQEAAEECGFDFQDNQANTIVWHASTEQPFLPSMPAQPGEHQREEQQDQQPTVADPASQPEPPDEQAAEKAVHYKSFVREFRKLALSCLDNNKLFTLKQADCLNQGMLGSDPVIHDQIRRDHHELGQAYRLVCGPEARKELVKDHFNNKYSRAALKALAQGGYVG